MNGGKGNTRGGYAIGVDYGTLSVRALLVEVATGRETAVSVFEYPHGLIEDTLPATGEKLPPDWAIQDPRDYLEALSHVIPAVLRDSGVSPAEVIGVGVDFTASTVLPIREDGTPLCFLPAFRGEKHAYVKKWKHHAAQYEANRLNDVARERGEDFLSRYGGRISSEWLFPKLMQILDEAPAVFDAMDRFIEASDWIVMQLTGVETRNSCAAGYKALWSKRTGYPDDAFFHALDPRLEHACDTRLSRAVLPIGSKAGEITEAASRRTGLLPGTAVAVGNVDAHVAVPAVGIDGPGRMLMILGTSTCHMVLGESEIPVPGICGSVEDGILPGYVGYEAGQSCVGDHFDWFVRRCVPEGYHEEARARGMDIHQLLRSKVRDKPAGASGLLALDWWNGNRSVLVDADLTGMMLGMTLGTKPEEIYRALIEATAFGTREIIGNFEAHGVRIRELVACGGIAAKDEMTMQIYADVCNREIRVSASGQTAAFGAAMFGAVAAGSARGGYDSIFEAARAMPRMRDESFRPNPASAEVYDRLFQEYRILHDYFGRGGNDVMKRLKEIRNHTIG